MVFDAAPGRGVVAMSSLCATASASPRNIGNVISLPSRCPSSRSPEAMWIPEPDFYTSVEAADGWRAFTTCMSTWVGLGGVGELRGAGAHGARRYRRVDDKRDFAPACAGIRRTIASPRL